MHWTKFKYGKEKKKKKKKKQRAITQRLSKQESCALHSPLMRSIHPQNFITVASIVLDICTGQKSSMKVNKGQ